MNISPLLFDCTNGYDGTAVEIYVSGCWRGCQGCHNPEMQRFDYGLPVHYGELLKELFEHKEWFDIISVLGGDLVCQEDDDAHMFSKILRNNFPDKSFVLFTGAELSEVPQWCKDIFDTIKTGQYIEALRQPTGLASSNQRLHKKGSDYL